MLRFRSEGLGFRVEGLEFRVRVFQDPSGLGVRALGGSGRVPP